MNFTNFAFTHHFKPIQNLLQFIIPCFLVKSLPTCSIALFPTCSIASFPARLGISSSCHSQLDWESPTQSYVIPILIGNLNSILRHSQLDWESPTKISFEMPGQAEHDFQTVTQKSTQNSQSGCLIQLFETRCY